MTVRDLRQLNQTTERAQPTPLFNYDCRAVRLRYHSRPAREECRKEKIMLFRERLTLGCVIGLVTVCLVASARTQAQSNKPAESVQEDRDQILKQLLTEVRELRLVLQRATVSNTRF